MTAPKHPENTDKTDHFEPMTPKQPDLEATVAPTTPEKVDVVLPSGGIDFDSLNIPPTQVLEDEIVRLKDQLMRNAAEVENVRRRAAEDVAKAHKFSIEKFAEALVPVQDSLEKAMHDDSGDVATLRAGVELTFKQLIAALEKSGVVALDPKGEKFDPNFHQAISVIPAELESGMVVEVLQKGYKIAERVLRPALVVVAQ